MEWCIYLFRCNIIELDEKLAQSSAGYNSTDEAEACTCDDAETGISLAEDNFPYGTFTVAVVISLSCLYSIHN